MEIKRFIVTLGLMARDILFCLLQLCAVPFLVVVWIVLSIFEPFFTLFSKHWKATQNYKEE